MGLPLGWGLPDRCGLFHVPLSLLGRSKEHRFLSPYGAGRLCRGAWRIPCGLAGGFPVELRASKSNFPV